MSPWGLDIIFVAVALLGALASAWYYVAAILNRDRAALEALVSYHEQQVEKLCEANRGEGGR